MTEHKVGRELDALIHTEIFGHEICPVHQSHSCCGRTLFNYSTQIAPAWLVVEKMSPYFDIFQDGGGWVCRFGWGDKKTLAAYADTAPLAICLAALKAVGDG